MENFSEIYVEKKAKTHNERITQTDLRLYF